MAESEVMSLATSHKVMCYCVLQAGKMDTAAHVIRTSTCYPYTITILVAIYSEWVQFCCSLGVQRAMYSTGEVDIV